MAEDRREVVRESVIAWHECARTAKGGKMFGCFSWTKRGTHESLWPKRKTERKAIIIIIKKNRIRIRIRIRNRSNKQKGKKLIKRHWICFFVSQ